MHTTIVGVDLAKEVIQVCVVKHKQLHSANDDLTPVEFEMSKFNVSGGT